MNQLAYAIYFNKMNKHISIHKIGYCNHIEKYGRRHLFEPNGG